MNTTTTIYTAYRDTDADVCAWRLAADDLPIDYSETFDENGIGQVYGVTVARRKHQQWDSELILNVVGLLGTSRALAWELDRPTGNLKFKDLLDALAVGDLGSAFNHQTPTNFRAEPFVIDLPAGVTVRELLEIAQRHAKRMLAGFAEGDSIDRDTAYRIAAVAAGALDLALLD